MKARRSGSSRKPWRTPRRVLSALCWLAVIVLFICYRDQITVEAICRYAPSSPWLRAGLLVALFWVKSLSVVVYSGILYAASGVLLPLPAAILVNLLGTVAMSVTPYGIGQKRGAAALEELIEKHPRLQGLSDLRRRNDLAFTVLLRACGLFSYDVISLYLGAAGVKRRTYLAGSLLGMLPTAILFPLFGAAIGDVSSPQFVYSLAAQIGLSLAASAAFRLSLRRRRKQKSE